MKATDNTIQWVKLGAIEHISLIAKDVIGYSMGCFIKFIDLLREETLRFDVNFPSQNGDGVGVLTGHRTQHIFSYAEKCKKATLYVKSYPNFKTLSKITNGPVEGYSDLAFSETSLLITVGNLPNYVVTIFNWRKGDKVGELHSKLNFEDQVIRCNWTKPIYVSQISRNLDKLLLWDVFTCCKVAVLAEHEISPPPKEHNLKFIDTLWTTEGGLYVLDVRACVYYYLVNEQSLERVIHEDLKGDSPTSFCWYKGGIVVSGPNAEMRHYKKCDVWECDWKIPVENVLRHILCNKTEFIIALTDEDKLMKISNTEEPVYLQKSANDFNDICMVYPAGQYFVTLRLNRIFGVYHSDSGNLITELELKHKTLAISENPEFPYIAVGYETGLMELLSIFNPEKVTLMASFNLTHNPINSIKFFEEGRIIVAGSLEIGEFFLIEGIPGTQMNIVTCLNTKCQIVDYMVVASKNCFRLFAIPVTGNVLAGNKIIRYCIVSKDNINVKEYSLQNTEFLYHRLIPTNKFNRDKVMYAVPFNSRSIHQLEVRRGDNLVHLQNEVKTGHLLRKFDFHLTKYYALTWGCDGFVMVRSNDFQKQVGMALPSHRYLGGVKKAYIHPLGFFIISLGRDNALVCTKIEKNILDPERNYEITEYMESTKFALMFKRPTIGFKPEERFKNKTWLEVENLLEAEQEKEICEEEKKNILAEFKNIQFKLNQLVTQNINGPENEKLDLLEFYLDTALYNQKRTENKHECKRTEIYLKALIVAQDKVSKYLMENCWHTMEVKRKVIRGIFCGTEVVNYALLPRDHSITETLSWVQEQRKIEQFLLISDKFSPWMILPENVLEDMSSHLCYKLEDYDNTKVIMGAQIDENVSSQTVETQIALAGSTTQTFFTISLAHYNQREVTSFHQCLLEEILAEHDILQLKHLFNKVLNDMVAVKQREMVLIKEKHDRLRHIISEHNYFSENKISLNIVDPQWSQREIPEMITQVYDHELSVMPYISPSEQDILDAKAAEEERIRLALLADDFRERALMAMMNGVLEIRWEDELKKDVPIPACMIEKQPENFNEEDLRTVKEYEEKVAFLNSERERYKNMLDVEFTKVSTAVRDSIRRFNQKLKDLADYRLQVESALRQLQLMTNINRYIEMKRCQGFQRKEALKVTVANRELTIANLKKTISFVQEELSGCKTTLENLQVKDKVLEKAFRKDFQDVSPILQEQAIKLYKKRPKVSYRHIASFTLLFELARCVLSGEKTQFLNSECLDYLRALDQMDTFVGLPPIIDENTYSHICRHRRLRIEHEVKVRAQQTQILDGEETINTFQKRLNINKDNMARVTSELAQLRQDYLHLLHNVHVQLVLRRGLVELPLTGCISDFDDAILVPKEEIQEINRLILEAGNKKIQTIMQNMAFRRKIMIMEWEHRRLRLTINDLQEHLQDINNVKVGKEMQQYLKAKALGRKTDLESFDAEIDRIAAAYENCIQGMKDKFMKLKKIEQSYKASNVAIDKVISSMNIDVAHLKMVKNNDLQSKEQEILRARMQSLLKRSSLMQQIEKNHSEILVLQTELELLRLRTYPTFKFKILHPE